MKKLIIILIVVSLLVAGVYSAITILKGRVVPNSYGGVTVGNEYKYANFSGAIATSTEIAGYQGTFGSVNILEDAAGAVTFYDATSTAAVTEGTYADKIAVFEDAAAEGTYVFDLQTNRGLVMVSADGFSFAGDWTVTYR